MKAQDGRPPYRQGTMDCSQPWYCVNKHSNGRLDEVEKEGKEYDMVMYLRFIVTEFLRRSHNQIIMGKIRGFISSKVLAKQTPPLKYVVPIENE